MKRFLPIVIALLMPLLLQARAVAQPSAPGAAAALSAMVVVGHVPDEVTTGKAVPLAPLNDEQQMHITIVIMPHRAAIAARLAQVTDPKSPMYRQFLTFDQFKNQYAASDSDVDTIEAWSKAGGLSESYRSRSNHIIVVEGTARQVQTLLSVGLHQYRLSGQVYFSNDKAPSVPAAIANKIADILGLSSFVQLHSGATPARGSAAATDLPQIKPGPFIYSYSDQVNVDPNLPSGRLIPAGNPGPFLDPADIWSSQAYDYAALRKVSHCCNPNHVASGSPKETSIAIVIDNKPLTSDLHNFFQGYNLAFNYHGEDVGYPACCDDEPTLDVEWAGATSNSFGAATDTAAIYGYFGGSLIDQMLDTWTAALDDDKARVVSSSTGAAEDEYGTIASSSLADFDDIFSQMTLEGWTIIASSGDTGGDTDCELGAVSFPSSEYNVVSAGGTTLNLSPGGTYGGETAWSGYGCSPNPKLYKKNGGGGGGGCSTIFPRPLWQPSACTGSHRAQPDISLNAITGQTVYYSFGGSGSGCTPGHLCPFVGTSIVAPELAGFFAQENSYLLTIGQAGAICGRNHTTACGTVGQAGPAIYAALTAPHDPYYDITSGSSSNGLSAGYQASPGYDKATGLGSANMLQLAWAINAYINLPGSTPPSVQFNGPQPGSWSATPQTVSFTIGGASMGLAGYTAAADKDPGDPTTHAAPGSGDPFYDGPAIVGLRSGTMSINPGCHTVFVRAWDNLGHNTVASYGPVCVGPLANCAYATNCVKGISGPPFFTLTCPTQSDFYNFFSDGTKEYQSSGLVLNGETTDTEGSGVLACQPGSTTCASFLTGLPSSGLCVGSPGPPPPPLKNCLACYQSNRQCIKVAGGYRCKGLPQ